MVPKDSYAEELVLAWNEFVAPMKLNERPYDIRVDMWNAFKAGWEASSNLNKLR